MVSIGSTNGVVSWSPVSGAMRYNYAVLTLPAPVPPSTATITTALSVNIIGLTPSTEYKFCLNTDCSVGSSTWICKSFTTKTSTTSIATQNYNTGIAIFPNPATDMATITVQNNTPDSKITVYNTSGTIITSIAVATAHTLLDISLYPIGLYIVKFTDVNGTSYQKLLKH
jgi:hypothetical protein